MKDVYSEFIWKIYESSKKLNFQLKKKKLVNEPEYLWISNLRQYYDFFSQMKQKRKCLITNDDVCTLQTFTYLPLLLRILKDLNGFIVKTGVFPFFIFYFTSTSRIFRQTLLIDAQWICKYFLKWKKDIRSLLSHIITTVPILGLCNKWDVTIEVVGSILYGGNSGESRSGIPVMVLSVGFCIKFIL